VKEDKSLPGINFMKNPNRYDSEFPGAEMQLFDPKKANTVQGVCYGDFNWGASSSALVIRRVPSV